MERWEVRACAQINPIRAVDPSGPHLEGLVSDVGDPGLFIPRLHLGGSLYFSPFDGLEVGGQFHYAAFDWTEPNTAGVLPFPPWLQQAMIMGGFGLRYSFRFSFGLALSGLVELNVARIRQTTYICAKEPCDSGYYIPGYNTPADTAKYRFHHVNTGACLFPNFFFQASYTFLEHFTVFQLFGLESNLKNVGFDPDITNIQQLTLDRYWMVVVAVGFEFTWKLLFASVTFFYPLEAESAIDFGPSFVFQVGLRL